MKLVSDLRPFHMQKLHGPVWNEQMNDFMIFRLYLFTFGCIKLRLSIPHFITFYQTD